LGAGAETCIEIAMPWPLLDPQPHRDLRIIAAHLLGEPSHVLALDEDLE